MQGELLQFKLQKVWTLVDLPNGKRAIGTKWVFRNKKDKRGIVIKNKARLVAQGYTQEEGIDYDKVFAHVARIEPIRLFLAYASFMRFLVYQMDIKSAFMYGIIEDEVYVCQPTGFKDPHFSNKVFKVEKALYGLHLAPRAWYETLSTYLLENRFRIGTINKTLFIKKDRDDILLVQVYVYDIIFGSTKKSLCDEFERMMHKRFQMSSIWELTFFLELQTASTLIEPNKALVKDAEAEDVDVHLYRSKIRSLMYLTAFSPDIMFDVCAYARFQVTPKTSHLHGRIAEIDADEYLSLINEIAQDQGRMNDEDLFGLNDLDGDLVIMDVPAGENVEHDATVAEKETLIEIKAAKPRARGVTIQEPSEFRTTLPSQPSQPLQAKDKGNRIMKEDGIFISQDKYVSDILKKFDFTTVKTASTPIEPNKALIKDAEAEDVDVHLYRSKIGSLMYLTASSPDIMFDAYTYYCQMKVNAATHKLTTTGEEKPQIQKETKVPYIEPQIEEHIPTPSHDPLPSGENRMQLSELMEICTKLSDSVLSLEQIKTNQAAKIEKLKQRGRIAEIDADEYLSLINEIAQDQGRMNDEDLFGFNDLDGDLVIMDVPAGENVEQDATVTQKEVSAAADEVVTTAKSVKADSAVTYSSVHSEARSWSIPSEDPYEQAAQQLFEESSEFCTRHHDAKKDRAAVRAEIEVLRNERLAYEQEDRVSQGKELGLIKPLSESSCSCSDNSFISDGAKRYGAWATGTTPGIRLIGNSTGRAGGRPGKFSGNTLGKS
nr:putative ribonuclease H-like domain-containing protein [Tanacetum cinerariifolium]